MNSSSSTARITQVLAFSFVFILFSGCATYQSKVNLARFKLKSGKAVEGAETLKPLAEEQGKDQLVYLFDYATLLQQAGRYQDSNQAFLKADKMAEFKDYHSVSKIGASLLTSEAMVQYKGENYEKVLINAMLAFNFLMLEDLDSALVETRRINEKLKLFKMNEEKKHTQNELAIYLGGVIWEANKDYDDAYISYEKVYKLYPHLPYIKQDLLRLAMLSQRRDKYNKWKAEFKGTKLNKDFRKKNYGEIVLLYQQGWGPRKYPNPESPRLPKLFPVETWTTKARLIVDERKKEESQLVYSVEEGSVQTFNDQMGALIAKRIAADVTKEIVADQIRQNNEALGELVRLGMYLSDRADLRQWSTLPESFQIARIFVPAGKHKIRVEGLNYEGKATGEASPEMVVDVRPGKKVFIPWRSFN